jgi:hypothetical protein
VLTPEEFDGLKAAIDGLNTLVTAFAIDLTVKERRSLAMVGNRISGFVERVYKYANEYPHLIPAYLDMPEFQKDWELFNQLKRLQMLLGNVVEKVVDTYKAAGSEAYTAARAFYHSIKAADNANTAGIQFIVEDLKKYYKKSLGPNPEETPPVVEETTPGSEAQQAA